jgi:hypothetical protein
MKATKNFYIHRIILLAIALTLSCSTDDSVEPIADPCLANPCASGCTSTCPVSDGQVTRDNVTTDGDVTDTDDGFQVDGTLTLDYDSAGPVVFNNADVDVSFDENGRMNGMTGTVEIPAMSNYFSFKDPVQADVGFFLGRFLNENRNFEIRLRDDIYYFVFNVQVNLELSIGANNDPEATRPLVIKAPEGGGITLIMDFSDPMFFFSLGGSSFSEDLDDKGKNRLLGISFGASYKGRIDYIPTNPVDPVVKFGARTVRSGTVSFWKVLEGNVMFFENAEFGADFNLEEPLDSEVNAGYYAGWNGGMGLSLPITSFASFDMPLAEGSAAIVTEGNSVTGVNAQAFINGTVDPDKSWWPDFIPLDWGTRMNAYGYVEQTGKFDVGLSGEFSARLATETLSVDGMMRFTNEALTMEGNVFINEEPRSIKAIMTKDSTTFIASRPDNFSEGIEEAVSQQIDSTFAATQEALDKLEKATEDYEFELSLRGFREALPPIIDNAHKIIDDAVAAGIANGRSQANKILNDNNRALCSDNISSVVNSVAKPYRDALNRMRNAVNNSNDTEQTRMELENALRQLASFNKIDKTVQVTIVHGNKSAWLLPACTQKSTAKRSIRIQATVLTSEQVSQINEAADNVKYIQETSNILIDAQHIVDQLPSEEELEAMRSRIQSCVSKLTNDIGDAGMTIYHEGSKIVYFIMINGIRHEATAYDIFNKNQVIAAARPNVEECR